jgi:hypothetical protein
MKLDTKKRLWMLLLKEDSDICINVSQHDPDILAHANQYYGPKVVEYFAEFVGATVTETFSDYADGGVILESPTSAYYVSVKFRKCGQIRAKLVRYLTKDDLELGFAVFVEPIITLRSDDIFLAVAKELYWLSHGVAIDYLVSAVRKLGFARLMGTLTFSDRPSVGTHPSFVAVLASKERYLPCRLTIDCALPTKVRIEGEDELVASVIRNFCSHT